VVEQRVCSVKDGALSRNQLKDCSAFFYSTVSISLDFPSAKVYCTVYRLETLYTASTTTPVHHNRYSNKCVSGRPVNKIMTDTGTFWTYLLESMTPIIRIAVFVYYADILPTRNIVSFYQCWLFLYCI
jgi:hypothetical protein